MITRISSIISSHATAIPSDEGRVYGLARKVPLPTVRPGLSNKDTYFEFTQVGLPEADLSRKKDLAQNSSLHGYGMTLYAASSLQKMIIRA
jgi:hypothetical protein